ncbi:hypothetical protein I6F36_20995 [Bradyrhizobium sp. BRP19]|uniref:hypothetical protein n=1 Tax=Bradyrhizobium sp. BRP19 TaxID=2793823 RepID=UPI001CD76DE8|nr:hypothetical protein [Bradyrhizobium sp. BRP19]MCA1549311.1 hypothetical protein [Bradyrhizobium sp. BRP19]
MIKLMAALTESSSAAYKTILMSTDPYAMLLHRRKEIQSELDDLRKRLTALETEDQELASAEKVLSRFGAAQPDFVALTAEGITVGEIKSSGKPEGTPTTPNMILALLREAQAQGKPGLEPKEMQIAIARRWWPTVKSEDVGPTAWRMWKVGRLVKDGSLYMLRKSDLEERITRERREEDEAKALLPWLKK